MTTTTNYPPLYGPTYPHALDAQLRALDADEQLTAFTAARRRLASDPYRPAYHFSPPQNVMNDPNGLCFWQGRWHLFYQYRPAGAHDRVHWGHTVSDDLIHWRDLPLALYPDTEKDCYSGQALVEDDRVIAIYHGTESGNAIATASDPLLLNWQKHPNNPVIPIVPIDDAGLPYRVFDPCIWKQDDGYYYSVSGTYKDGERSIDCQGIDHLFRSKDLAQWEHIGALLEDTLYAERGEDQAVPVFWHLERHRRQAERQAHAACCSATSVPAAATSATTTPKRKSSRPTSTSTHQLRLLHRRQPACAVGGNRARRAVHRDIQCEGRQAARRLGRHHEPAAPLLACRLWNARHVRRRRCGVAAI